MRIFVRSSRPVASSDPEAGVAKPLPDKETDLRGPSRRRRGVTAMEYLAMISLILVVLVLAVQHVGNLTKSMFQGSANATNEANESP